jgi:hypothetical protein
VPHSRSAVDELVAGLGVDIDGSAATAAVWQADRRAIAVEIIVLSSRWRRVLFHLISVIKHDCGT